MGQGNGGRLNFSKKRLGEQLDTQFHQSGLNLGLLQRKLRPVGNQRRGCDQRHITAVLGQQFGQHAAQVEVIVIVQDDAACGQLSIHQVIGSKNVRQIVAGDRMVNAAAHCHRGGRLRRWPG